MLHPQIYTLRLFSDELHKKFLYQIQVLFTQLRMDKWMRKSYKQISRIQNPISKKKYEKTKTEKS